MKYRKTALVEAEQFLPNEGKIPAGVFSSERADPRKSLIADWTLKTLEGDHVLRDGDYICTGPAGEKWNVKRSIFEETYEVVSDQQPTLTKEQAAIIGAFTGFAIGPFSDIHEYAERVLERPVWTHQFADQGITAELREAAKADFVALAYVAPTTTPARNTPQIGEL